MRARAVGRTGTLYGLQSSLSCSLIGDANRTVARARAVDWEGNCTAVCVRLGLCPSAPLSNSRVLDVLEYLRAVSRLDQAQEYYQSTTTPLKDHSGSSCSCR